MRAVLYVFWLVSGLACGVAIGTCMTGCKPSVFRVEKIECPVEVPPGIIAAFFGCGWDQRANTPVCPPGVSVAIPDLTLDACDMVNVDGGACDE